MAPALAVVRATGLVKDSTAEAKAAGKGRPEDWGPHPGWTRTGHSGLALRSEHGLRGPHAVPSNAVEGRCVLRFCSAVQGPVQVGTRLADHFALPCPCEPAAGRPLVRPLAPRSRPATRGPGLVHQWCPAEPDTPGSGETPYPAAVPAPQSSSWTRRGGHAPGGDPQRQVPVGLQARSRRDGTGVARPGPRPRPVRGGQARPRPRPRGTGAPPTTRGPGGRPPGPSFDRQSVRHRQTR